LSNFGSDFSKKTEQILKSQKEIDEDIDEVIYER